MQYQVGSNSPSWYPEHLPWQKVVPCALEKKNKHPWRYVFEDDCGKFLFASATQRLTHAFIGVYNPSQKCHLKKKKSTIDIFIAQVLIFLLFFRLRFRTLQGFTELSGKWRPHSKRHLYMEVGLLYHYLLANISAFAITAFPVKR